MTDQAAGGGTHRRDRQQHAELAAAQPELVDGVHHEHALTEHQARDW